MFCVFIIYFFAGVLTQKLMQIQVLVRHGARTQIYGLYNPQNISKDDTGQLTGAGVRQHFTLGRLLREEYVDKFQLFGTEDLTNADLYHVMTTNFNRTIMSAHALLYGMALQKHSAKINISVLHLAVPPLPKNQQMVFNQSLCSLPKGYWPIPLHTTDEKYDTILLGYEPETCPYTQVIRDFNKESSDMADLNNQWLVFFKHMQTKNLNITNITDGGFFADDIKCNQVNGDTIPNLTDEDLQGLDYVRSLFYQATQYRLYEQTKFQATPFIKKLLKNMDISSLKFQLFSAHDNNIFLILNLLNLSNWDCVNKFAQSKLSIFNKNSQQNASCHVTQYPEFASNAIFEVWSRTEIILDPSNMYVKFRYNGIYYPLCRAQKLECDYLNFRTEMEFLVDNTYDSICDISFSENYYKQQQSYDATIVIIVCTLIPVYMATILSCLVGLLYLKRLRLSKKSAVIGFQQEETNV